MYVIPSFLGGYASRRTEGRLDLQNYATFQKENTNWIVTPAGPVTKRPGIKNIGEGLGEQEGRWVTMKNGDADDDIFLLVEGRIFRLVDGLLTEMDVEDTAGAGYWQPLTDAELPDMQWVDVRTLTAHYVIMVHENMVPQYLKIKDADTVVMDDLDNLASLSFPATTATTTGTFCTTGGSDCPGVVCLYQSRLIFARTTDDPGYVSVSKVGSMTDFTYSSPATADEGWEGYITEAADYYVQWIVPWKTLAVGTDSGVWLLADNNIDASTIEQFIWYGRQGANKVVGYPIDANLIYSGITGKDLKAMTFSEEQAGYNIPSLNEFADDILTGVVLRTTYQSSPFQLMWVLCEDGTAAGLTYSRSGIAWHKHLFGSGKTKDILIAKYEGRQRLLVLNIDDQESAAKSPDGNYYWLAGIMDELKNNPTSSADVHLDFYKYFTSESIDATATTTGANTYVTLDTELTKDYDYIYCKVTEGGDDWVDREFMIGDYTPASSYEYELLDVLGNEFDSTALAGEITKIETGFRTKWTWPEFARLAEWASPDIRNTPNKYSSNYNGLYRNGDFEEYDGYDPGMTGIVLGDESEILYNTTAVGVTIPSLLIPFSPYVQSFLPIGVARTLIRLDNAHGFGMLTEDEDGYVDVISFDINEVEEFDVPAESFSGIAEKDFQTPHSYEPKISMFHDIPAPCTVCALMIDFGEQDGF